MSAPAKGKRRKPKGAEMKILAGIFVSLLLCSPCVPQQKSPLEKAGVTIKAAGELIQAQTATIEELVSTVTDMRTAGDAETEEAYQAHKRKILACLERIKHSGESKP